MRIELTRCIVFSSGAAETKARKAARSMFERFTDQARRIVVLAQEEARMLNHNYIGTEHILLGLIREGEGKSKNPATQVLNGLGVDPNRVRQQVVALVSATRGEDEAGVPRVTAGGRKRKCSSAHFSQCPVRS